MSLGRILFLAIFLFSSSAILGSGSFLEMLTYQSEQSISTSAKANFLLQQQSLREEYQRELQALLAAAGQKNFSYNQLAKELLSLKVPADYRELHLKLVSALDSLNQDQSKTEQVKQRLEALKDRYVWLTANLSLFMANNF